MALVRPRPRPRTPMIPGRCLVALLLAGAAPAAAQRPTAADYQADALSVEPLIQANYAYLDRFANQRVPTSDELQTEAAAVHDLRSLVRYTARALLALADLHALATRNLPDSYAPPPPGTDLWIEWLGGAAVVTAVREDHPAERAGVRTGDRLLLVEGVPVVEAVEAFWTDLGLPVTDERSAFALLQLTAGRHDRPRSLTFATAGTLAVPVVERGPARPPLSTAMDGDTLVIRFNDSLGDDATIGAFDLLMKTVPTDRRVRVDLRDTPSGGNTTIARAIMGWFVTRPTGYQIHNLVREERNTGIARQWIEQVLPRDGKHHAGAVEVRVGRWTGSMGEGLAVGLDAIGASVCGDRIAGLRGAVDDLTLKHSGLVFKLPFERLSAVDGTPQRSSCPRPAHRRPSPIDDDAAVRVQHLPAHVA